MTVLWMIGRFSTGTRLSLLVRPIMKSGADLGRTGSSLPLTGLPRSLPESEANSYEQLQIALEYIISPTRKQLFFCHRMARCAHTFSTADDSSVGSPCPATDLLSSNGKWYILAPIACK